MGEKGDGSALIRKGTGTGAWSQASESLPRTAQQPSDAKEPKVIPVGRGGIQTGLRTRGQLGATLPAA